MMPREKALEHGISSLSNNELLVLIVKSAYRDKNVFELVDEILELAKGFENLLSLSYEELINTKCAVMPVLVTTYGLQKNTYSGNIRNVIVMDDLFAK